MTAVDVDVWLSVAVFCLILSIHADGSENSLYTTDDHVTVLNADNFYSVVPRSQNAWFLEFYASWCGHCIRFAPTWKQLAKDTAAWCGVIQLGVVDCSMPENLALCRDYNIVDYPTLKFLNAFSDKKDSGTVFLGTRTVPDLRHAIIQFLQNITEEGHRPPTLPHLAPLGLLEDIWGDVTSSIRHTVIIFESVDSDLGQELLLDFASHTDLVLRRMMKENVSKFGVREFPSLFLIEKEGTFKKIADHKDRAGFRAALSSVLGLASHPEATTARQSALQHPQRPAAHSDLVYQADLESGLHYSLRQEVAGHTVISGAKLEALKAYVEVLVKYFPGNEKVVRYLKLVGAYIEQQSEPLTGATWLRNINQKQTEDAQLSSVVDWHGCLGSALTYRGYPCSVWTIFHTLTVNAYLDAGHMEDFDPLKVLIAMRDYIKHFFGCRECSENFLKMAFTVEREVKAPTDGILWLWRAHNKANLRLRGDLTEDPKYPKIQFPSKTQCSECYTLHRGKSVFNEIQVVRFLTKMFSQAEIVQHDGQTGPLRSEQKQASRKEDMLKFAQNREERHQKRLGEVHNVRKSINIDDVEQRVGRLRDAELNSRSSGHSSHVYMAWGLNRVDISMCVLFYIVCTGILILLYFHLSHNHRINIWKIVKKPFWSGDRIHI